MHQSAPTQEPSSRQAVVKNSLTGIFGTLPDEQLAQIEHRLTWYELTAGAELFRQGDTSDGVFFVISGRLRALVDTDGEQTSIGEIRRGESVGEMALLTGEPRMATVVAIRDTVLVGLTKQAFEAIVQLAPLLAIHVGRVVIQRLKKAQAPAKAVGKPVNICLLPITPLPDFKGFMAQLHEHLGGTGPAMLLSSARLNALHQTPDLAQVPPRQADAYQQLTAWLDDQEARHEFVLYACDYTHSEWTKRCLGHADIIYFVADAQQPSGLSFLEKCLSTSRGPGLSIPQQLILLHGPQTTHPRGTANWLQPRQVQAHYHIRPYLPTDMARLARLVSGNAIGLVLAGGGAKGFAHLGVFRALQEASVPVDYVGGTSMGAMMAGLIAFDLPPERARQMARNCSLANPTRDYDLLPLVSLIKGNQLDRMIRQTIQESVGFDIQLEDTWLPLFVVSSNYTQAREEVHTHGSLFRYMRASISIPGLFPPVIEGPDLLMDGAMFNNFPTDVMSYTGVGTIIGVNLSRDEVQTLDIDQVPTSRQLLRDRLRPKAHRRYQLPSLLSILLNTTLLCSTARQKTACHLVDLQFSPDVSRFGLIDWESFDAIYATGYTHATEVLRELTPHQQHRLSGQPATANP